jgi:hypothetical protein
VNKDICFFIQNVANKTLQTNFKCYATEISNEKQMKFAKYDIKVEINWKINDLLCNINDNQQT